MLRYRKASVDDGDDINNYSVILKKHINRMEVAEKVIEELRPKMTAFHGKVEGNLAKIEALFTDMAPEPQKVCLADVYPQNFACPLSCFTASVAQIIFEHM